MPKRPFYRSGRLIVASAIALIATKTLASTGEHDIWSGSGAVPLPVGTTPIVLSSSSVQDAAETRDTWTITGTEGTDPYDAIEVDGVLHASIVIGAGSDAALAAAVNSGSKESWLVEISTAPDSGDSLTLEIGEQEYGFATDGEDAAGCAAALATLAAADAHYTVTAADNYLVCVAKLPAVDAPAISIVFPSSGAGSASQLFAAGPPSAVMSAVAGESQVVLTALAKGEAYVVTAETDNRAATHSITGDIGTGVQYVEVHYIDTTGVTRCEQLALDGLTPVSTGQDAIALLTVEAVAVGSAGAAVGTITIADDDGSPTTLATIAPGDSTIHRLWWRAGAGKRVQVCSIDASNESATPCTLRLRTKGPSGARLVGQWLIDARSRLVFEWEHAPLELTAGETVYATLEGNGATATVCLLAYSEG